MELIYNGKKVEFDSELEDGARELDMLLPDEKENDDDKTVEIKEEELEKIKSQLGDENK